MQLLTIENTFPELVHLWLWNGILAIREENRQIFDGFVASFLFFMLLGSISSFHEYEHYIPVEARYFPRGSAAEDGTVAMVGDRDGKLL